MRGLSFRNSTFVSYVRSTAVVIFTGNFRVVVHTRLVESRRNWHWLRGKIFAVFIRKTEPLILKLLPCLQHQPNSTSSLLLLWPYYSCSRVCHLVPHYFISIVQEKTVQRLDAIIE